MKKWKSTSKKCTAIPELKTIPMIKTGTIELLSIFCSLQSYAQFAAPVGSPPTTAIHKDSSTFVAWATNCVVQRGYFDIADPGFGPATFVSASAGVGIAGSSVVSLGASGVAVLTFLNPIANGPGFDFAVFENAFNDEFLELAVV